MQFTYKNISSIRILFSQLYDKRSYDRYHIQVLIHLIIVMRLMMYVEGRIALILWLSCLVSRLTSKTDFIQCTKYWTCPRDILTYECRNIGGGFTIWSGSAFQCVNTNQNLISLRHSQFSSLDKPQGVCNDGAIIARAIGVDGNNYTSQLNVSVSEKMNNTTVQCSHDYNLTLRIIFSAVIFVAEST